MSSLIVKVVEFDLQPHPTPDTDRLMIATPKGMSWQCCVGKEEMSKATLGIYIPIDSLLPYSLAKFLALPDCREGEPYKIRTIKLRGAVSQGLLISSERAIEYMEENNAKIRSDPWRKRLQMIGENVADLLAITKHVTVYPEGSELIENPPGFVNWTDVESYNTFSHVLAEGTEVILTEKIHGESLKVGWMESDEGYTCYVGTKYVCFKPGTDNEYTQTAFRLGLDKIMEKYKGWIVFGEIFGPGVQKRMHYGLKEKSIRVFGVFNGQRFLNYDELSAFAKAENLEMVPVLYRGPWKVELLELADGESFCSAHIREGFVISLAEEVFHPEVGRVILKVVGKKFLLKNYDA